MVQSIRVEKRVFGSACSGRNQAVHTAHALLIRRVSHELPSREIPAVLLPMFDPCFVTGMRSFPSKSLDRGGPE
jgi:hypothetical protein